MINLIRKLVIKMRNLKTNKITREELSNLNEDDIMFIVNPGRMGNVDGITFVIKGNNEFIVL